MKLKLIRFPSHSRIREAPKLSFEESERRAHLLKEWSRYKRTQHQTEMDVIQEALEAQRQALDELKLESEELYKAAVSPDTDMFPFQHEGPCYTPPITNYEAPEGKYNDITRVYTQWGSVSPEKGIKVVFCSCEEQLYVKNIRETDCENEEPNWLYYNVLFFICSIKSCCKLIFVNTPGTQGQKNKVFARLDVVFKSLFIPLLGYLALGQWFWCGQCHRTQIHNYLFTNSFQVYSETNSCKNISCLHS